MLVCLSAVTGTRLLLHIIMTKDYDDDHKYNAPDPCRNQILHSISQYKYNV